MHPSAEVAHPGTFRGVVETIPYFKDLGVTSLELLPVQEFDELENRAQGSRYGEAAPNYWGYNTIAFFAPKGRYSSFGLGRAGRSPSSSKWCAPCTRRASR